MADFFVENYENLSDTDLLHLAQAGHADAVLALINRYADLVRLRAAALSKGQAVELDDLAQEGLIAVYSAIRSYDFQSASFSTFARLCVDRAVLTELRKQYRKKQIPESKLVPIDAALPAASDGPEAIVIEREAYRSFLDSLKERLSALEYRILIAYLNGDRYDEIARSLSLKPKTVDNALSRIRRKLK